MKCSEELFSWLITALISEYSGTRVHPYSAQWAELLSYLAEHKLLWHIKTHKLCPHFCGTCRECVERPTIYSSVCARSQSWLWMVQMRIVWWVFLLFFCALPSLAPAGRCCNYTIWLWFGWVQVSLRLWTDRSFCALWGAGEWSDEIKKNKEIKFNRE